MGKNRVKEEDFSKFSTGEIPVYRTGSSSGPTAPKNVRTFLAQMKDYIEKFVRILQDLT